MAVNDSAGWNSDTVLEIIKHSSPEEASKKLAQSICRITQSDGVEIYYTRTVDGDACLAKLPHTDGRKVVEETEQVIKPNYRTLSSLTGACKWVLENNSWLYTNNALKKPTSTNGAFSFECEVGEKVFQASIACDWSKDDDLESKTAFALVPMCWMTNKYHSSANAILVLWKLPDNPNPRFNSEQISTAQGWNRTIEICCEHILRASQIQHHSDTLRLLTQDIEGTTSHHDATAHSLKAVAQLVDAKICLLIEIVHYPKEQERCVYVSNVFVNDHESSRFSRAGRNLRNFFFKSEDRMALENGVLKDELSRELTSYNLRAAPNLLLKLRYILHVNNYSVIAVLDTMQGWEKSGTNARQQVSIEETNQLSEKLRVILELHQLKAASHKVNKLRKTKNKSSAETFRECLKALTITTGCDYAQLYLLKNDVQIELTKYNKLDGTFSVQEFISNDVSFRKSLTWESLRQNQHIYIPNIECKELSAVSRMSVEAMQSIIGQDYEMVKSLLSFPFGFNDDTGDHFLGTGAIELIGLKQNYQLPTASISLTKTFAEFLFQYYRESSKIESLNSLSKITNSLSKYSGHTLSMNLISKLEQWSKLYLKRRYLVSLQVRDVMGDLIQGCSKSIEDNKDKIASLTSKNQTGKLRLGTSHFYYHKARIAISGINELNGYLVFFCEYHIFEEHSKLIDEAAVDISTLICQEHLRHKRTRQLTRFKHAIIAPVGAIESSAMAIRRLVKDAQFKSEKDLDLFNRSLTSINRDTNTISNWTNLSRVLGQDDNAQVTLQKQSISQLIASCVERYEDIALRRNIEIEVLCKNDLVNFFFDPFALDIVISNILDNAVKYAYFNTIIKITYGKGWDTFFLTVADTGHGLPKNFKAYYREGKHFTWQDPYRTIPGGGYGISIIESLIRAHRGSFKIESEEVTKIKKQTQRHRVVARVEIPYIL